MLPSLDFLQQVNVKKSEKLTKITKVEQKKSSHLLNNLMHFNSQYLKVTKNQGLTLSLDNTILEKRHWEGQIDLQSQPFYS